MLSDILRIVFGDESDISLDVDFVNLRWGVWEIGEVGE